MLREEARRVRRNLQFGGCRIRRERGTFRQLRVLLRDGRPAMPSRTFARPRFGFRSLQQLPGPVESIRAHPADPFRPAQLWLEDPRPAHGYMDRWWPSQTLEDRLPRIVRSPRFRTGARRCWLPDPPASSTPNA